MPAATTKSELVAATRKDWAKLSALIATVPGDVAVRPFEEDTSIKDVVAHRAHWIDLFFQWLEEGEAAQMPDHGVKWSELKPYNARLRERDRPVPWPDVTARLARAHRRLLMWIEAADEVTLYGGPMPGGNGKWTTGRFAEAAGPSHYRSAAKFIRACTRCPRQWTGSNDCGTLFSMVPGCVSRSAEKGTRCGSSAPIPRLPPQL